MCDPISIIGLTLSTAGAIQQGKAQKDYIAAVNAENRRAYEMSQRAREAERARQAQMEAEANAAFEATNNNLTREEFDTDKEEAAQEFVATLDAAETPISAETRLPGQEGASVDVQGAITSRINNEASKTRDRIKAFSQLQGYGSAGMGRALELGETGDFLSILGGLRRGSLAVAQQEQEVRPADVTKGSTVLGDILSGVGGIMAYGGPNLFNGSGGGLFNGSGLFGPGMTRGTPLKWSPSVMPPVR